MSPARHLMQSVLAIGLTLLAFALVGACTKARAEPTTVGLHLGSVHVPAKDYLSNVNPGLYVRQGAWQAGAFRNSYGRTSAYAGGVLQLGDVDVMVGLATGYDKRCAPKTTVTTVTTVNPDGSTSKATYRSTELDCKGWSRHRIAPLAALSWSPQTEILTARPRITVMPGIGDASWLAHLSLEWTR